MITGLLTRPPAQNVGLVTPAADAPNPDTPKILEEVIEKVKKLSVESNPSFLHRWDEDKVEFTTVTADDDLAPAGPLHQVHGYMGDPNQQDDPKQILNIDYIPELQNDHYSDFTERLTDEQRQLLCAIVRKRRIISEILQEVVAVMGYWENDSIWVMLKNLRS